MGFCLSHCLAVTPLVNNTRTSFVVKPSVKMSDEVINSIYQKIDREKILINAAVAMRASSNPQVQLSLDAQIKEGRKNLSYLEQRLQELEEKRMGQRMDGMSLGQSGGGPPPPAHGNLPPGSQRNNSYGEVPQPPPKGGYDQAYDQSGYGPAGGAGYMDTLGAGSGMMPPRPPYGPSNPAAGMPKARPNYSKLGGYNSALCGPSD